MILPSSTISHIVTAYGAISPVSEERLNNIEGNAFDLTLDEVIEIRGKSWPQTYEGHAIPNAKPPVFFGVRKRRVPLSQQLTWHENVDGNWEIRCDPGMPYLFKTAEVVTVPDGIEAQVIPRSSVFRAGAFIVGSWVPHGFTGNLFIHFSIPSNGNPFVWERGARFASLKFHKVAPGIGQPYDGIWHDDKSATDGDERAY